MKPGAQFVLGAAARLYVPLIALFGLVLLAERPAGGGIGFVAGLALGLMLILHALVFGAAAAERSFPPPLAKACLALGVIGAVAGAGLPGWSYARQVIEAGAFLATISVSALLVQVTFGRAPTLPDAEL